VAVVGGVAFQALLITYVIVRIGDELTWFTNSGQRRAFGLLKAFCSFIVVSSFSPVTPIRPTAV
jgi:hypothetical protein